MRKSIRLGLIGVWLLTGSAVLVRGQAQVVVLDGATLIDGTGAPPVANARVVIRGDRIAAAGPADRTPSPAGAEVVNLRGKYVVPGFIDGHVHYRNWQGELFLAYGVTTVFEIGDYTEWLVALKEGVQKGKIYAPRLYVAGNLIERVNKTADSFSIIARKVKASNLYHTLVRDADEGRAQVRSLVKQGADLIKLDSSVTGELLQAIVAEAQAQGRPVLAHTNDVRESALAGVNGIPHLWGVSATLMNDAHRQAYRRGEIASPYAWMEPSQIDELVKLLVGKDVYVNPLLVHEHKALSERAAEYETEDMRVLADPNLNYVPPNDRAGIFSLYHRVRNYSLELGLFPPIESLSPERQAEFRRGYANAKEFTRRFVKAGGKLFTGSSGGSTNLPGVSLHHELQALVDVGLTPMEALLTVTRYPAELLRVGDQVGTIAPGRYADVVVVTADPLADIRNLKKVDQVYRNGARIDRTFHAEYTIPIKDPLAEVMIDTPNYPVPSIGTIVPKMVIEGAPPFTLEVRGERFTPVSQVDLGGMGLKTTFVNTTLIKAAVPTQLVVVPGTYPVTATNPAPGGGPSKSFGLIVRYADTEPTQEVSQR